MKAIEDRLLSSDEYCGDDAVPQVAYDALEVIRELRAKLLNALGAEERANERCCALEDFVADAEKINRLVVDSNNELQAELAALVAAAEQCREMLLSEPEMISALTKAENMLHWAIAGAKSKKIGAPQAELAAIKAQGEPVGYVFADDTDGGRINFSDWSKSFDEVVRGSKLPVMVFAAPQPAANSELVAALKAQDDPVACLVGLRGSAFDMPETKRAYTYDEQPGNVVASRLGSAWIKAKNGGDNIDAGLSLLKELQAEGFGVFDIGAIYTAPRPAVNAELLDALQDIRDYIHGDLAPHWDCSRATTKSRKVVVSMIDAAIAKAEGGK